MRIAVGVDGSPRDDAVLAWVARFAHPGDDVHVVHAYQELAFGGSAWLPAIRANDRRRLEARRLVTAAQAVLHAALRCHEQVSIGGSVIVGRAPEVLADLSTVADLVVVGGRQAPAPACVLDSTCPVVVVPGEWNDQAPHGRDVGLVCGSVLPAAAMDRAVDLARRSGLSVLVVQSIDPSEPSTPERLEQLDMQVAAWERPGGPPLIAEIRRDGLAEGLRSLSPVLALLVVDGAWGQADAAIRIALEDLGVPVLRIGRDRAATACNAAVLSAS